jgi:uncharacterized membrane protein
VIPPTRTAASGRSVVRRTDQRADRPPREVEDTADLRWREDRYAPLPSPELLRRYEEVIPGFAREYTAAFVRQGRHRQRMEWLNLLNGTLRSLLGLIVGTGTALTFGYWAVQLILGGHDTAGSVLGAADLVAIVAVFLFGYGRIAADLTSKRKTFDQLRSTS